MKNSYLYKNYDLNVPEILAPAGGRNQFFAALNAGADAVYLGLKEFNARGRAENFTIPELEELVPFAKKQGMKVLVTLNILLKDCEIPILIERLSQLQWIGVEAVIVQDLGVARMVREFFPNLRMHASTQMAVHNLHGVRKAKELGFRRVVVARELTIQELKLIRKKLPRNEVEIEAFCHGSLCYSYSGLCFFSGAEDARSGNRGECAYTCRKPYKILNEPGHGFLFSMKDLDSSQDLDKLALSGVDTLKIEGRKKDAQYVATVVGLYRKRLNEIFGYDTSPQGRSVNRNFRKDMSFSFHRDTTSFFMNGRYHENVIDLANPTHKGLLLGHVEKVQGRTIEFKTAEALECYDGLRVDRNLEVFHAKPQHGSDLSSDLKEAQKRYKNESIQFSLRDLTVRGKRVHDCKKFDTVRVRIPDDGPIPQEGDPIFKTRSNELKRSTEALIKSLNGQRLMALKQIQLELDFEPSGERLKVVARAMVGARLLLEMIEFWPAERPRGPSSLSQDIERYLQLFGSFGVEADLTLKGDLNWFVPKRLIKEMKKRIGENLQPQIQRVTEDSIQTAFRGLRDDRSPFVPESSESKYSIKIDRLEYLSYLGELKSQYLVGSISEIIFEPKRAFLGNRSPQDVMERLFEFCENNRLNLRLALPTVSRSWDEALLKRWVSNFHKLGGRSFDVGNVGAISLLNSWSIDIKTLDISSDFTMYALNTLAVQELGAMGVKRTCLSVEDDESSLEEKLKSWPKIAPIPEVILYKDTPLFIAEACSLTALHKGCPTADVCGYRTLEVENEDHERFFIAHESCKSVVYGKSPYSISQYGHKLKKLGVRQFRLDFLTRPYELGEIASVLAAVEAGRRVNGSHSANFSRELL